MKSAALRRVYLAAAAAVLPAFAGPAMAQSILASECGTFGLKNSFGDNEPICALVNPAIGLFGSADACVVPPGAAATDGNDVSAGGCNTVPFGSSLQEVTLWLPPTVAGIYDLVIVNSSGGEARDSITIVDTGGAPPTISAERIAAIKSAAGAQKRRWGDVQTGFEAAATATTLTSVGFAVASGNFVSAALAGGGLVGVPISYNSQVIARGKEIVKAVTGAQAQRYADLEADPPDPDYRTIVPIDLGAIGDDLESLEPLYYGLDLRPPYAALSGDPLEGELVALANALAEEAAAVRAFMRAFEKYQGAEAADDVEFIVITAGDVADRAALMRQAVEATAAAAQAVRDRLVAIGLGGAVIDGAALSALMNRIASSGLTPEEEASLRSAGFGNADIDILIERARSFDYPSGTVSPVSLLDEALLTASGMTGELDAVTAEAEDVVSERSGEVTITVPTADAGGPYMATQGQPVTLEGTGSTVGDPAFGMTYEWDLDLDGDFDDRVGPVVDVVFDQPGSLTIGLRVTNAPGEQDADYAVVDIAGANAAPVIDSFAPADLAPVAGPGRPLAFSLSASDPDGDTVSIAWRRDGTEIAAGPNYLFEPAPGLTGTTVIQAIVSDGVALSPDAVEQRVVTLEPDIAVPDVTGLSEADAVAALLGNGLTLAGRTDQPDAAVPAGVVLTQSPAAGTLLPPGSGVTLVVSTGPLPAAPGDLDGDGDVDRDDLSTVLAARNQPAAGPEDPRDLDGSGTIDALDARRLVTLCTRPRCAVE